MVWFVLWNALSTILFLLAALICSFCQLSWTLWEALSAEETPLFCQLVFRWMGNNFCRCCFIFFLLYSRSIAVLLKDSSYIHSKGTIRNINCSQERKVLQHWHLTLVTSMRWSWTMLPLWPQLQVPAVKEADRKQAGLCWTVLEFAACSNVFFSKTSL